MYPMLSLSALIFCWSFRGRQEASMKSREEGVPEAVIHMPIQKRCAGMCLSEWLAIYNQPWIFKRTLYSSGEWERVCEKGKTKDQVCRTHHQIIGDSAGQCEQISQSIPYPQAIRVLILLIYKETGQIVPERMKYMERQEMNTSFLARLWFCFTYQCVRDFLSCSLREASCHYRSPQRITREHVLILFLHEIKYIVDILQRAFLYFFIFLLIYKLLPQLKTKSMDNT